MPAYQRVSLLVFFIYLIMFVLQYWNAQAAEWRGAGCSSPDRAVVEQRMRRSAQQCDYCVRFRIQQVPGLSPVPAVVGE